MNHALRQVAAECELTSEDRRTLRLHFGLVCANRVRHLLEDPRAVELLDVLRAFAGGNCDEAAVHSAALEAAALANRHRGSASIDGSKHSAVSATYAVANALAGRALEAADYAAYATVYGYGGYAVNDPDSFSLEYAWQVEALRQLLRDETSATALALISQ